VKITKNTIQKIIKEELTRALKVRATLNESEVDAFELGYEDATSGVPPQGDSQEYYDGYNDSRLTMGEPPVPFKPEPAGPAKRLDPDLLQFARAYPKRKMGEANESGQRDLSSYEYAGYMSVLRPDQFGGAVPRRGTPEYDAFMKGWDAAKADQQNNLEEDDGALDGAAFDGWTDDQAQRTYRSMGGDFDKVVDKADDFADDPHAYAATLQKKATGKWPTEEADDFGEMPELSEEDEAEPRHLQLVPDEPQESESVTAQLSGDPDGDMEGYESPEELASLYADFEEEGLTPGEEAEDAARYQDNWREFTRQGKHLSVVEQRLLRFFQS